MHKKYTKVFLLPAAKLYGSNFLTNPRVACYIHTRRMRNKNSSGKYKWYSYAVSLKREIAKLSAENKSLTYILNCSSAFLFLCSSCFVTFYEFKIQLSVLEFKSAINSL